jgi:hypothetical protein
MVTPTKDKMAKAEKLSKSIVKDLDSIVNLYFNNYDSAKELFETANMDWKKHCYNVNRRQKLVKVDINAFEKRVKEIIADNPQFQDKTIDFTKL